MKRTKKSKRSPDASAGCGPNPPAHGQVVLTACGSRVRFDQNVPCGQFHDRPVYFCLPVCKHDFDQNPESSCLAMRLDDDR